METLTLIYGLHVPVEVSGRKRSVKETFLLPIFQFDYRLPLEQHKVPKGPSFCLPFEKVVYFSVQWFVEGYIIHLDSESRKPWSIWSTENKRFAVQLTSR